MARPLGSRIGKSALALTGVLAVVGALPAAATPIEEEGLWYFDRFLVQDAHDVGITGKGVTIAVIDRPVNLEIPTLADADIHVQDPVCIHADGSRPTAVSTEYDVSFHGTDVVSFLVGSGAGFPGQTGVKGLAPDATVLTYAVLDEEQFEAHGACTRTELPETYFDHAAEIYGIEPEPVAGGDDIGVSMHAAMDAGADIISISMGAFSNDIMTDAVARAVREGVIVVAALPNSNEDILSNGSSPASSNGTIGVNRIDADGETPQQNYVAVVAPGESMLVQGKDGDWHSQDLVGGTSYAAPIVTGNLALAMQKYPDATPNQLIQSLIHNTGAEPHPLGWDPVHGYGVVITDVFLAADPTQYPDVNPMVHDMPSMMPWIDDIWPWLDRSDEPLTNDDRPWPIFTPEPNVSPGTSPETGTDPTSASSTIATDNPDPIAIGWLIPAIVVGVLILVAIAIIITIVVIRANRPTGGPHGTQ